MEEAGIFTEDDRVNRLLVRAVGNRRVVAVQILAAGEELLLGAAIPVAALLG